jgi:DNA-binding MarR family transcriptional regulator
MLDDEDVAELAYVILSIARKLSIRSQETREVIALNGTEVEVMRTIHLNPGLSATDVAARLGIQRSNVSAAVRVLEAHRLVSKTRAEHDGRAVALEASDAAIANLELVRQGWADRLRMAGDDVLADSVAVRDVLARLAERLDVPVVAAERSESWESSAS